MAVQDIINNAVTDTTQQSLPQSVPEPVASVTPPAPTNTAPAFTANAADLSAVPNIVEAPTSDPIADLQAFMAGFQPDTSDLDEEGNELRQERSSIQEGSTRTEMFDELDSEFDLTGSRMEVAELDEEIARMKADFDKAITDEEGRTIAGRFITGRQAQILRQKATAVGALESIRKAKQGKVTAAEQIIKDTIDREFQDRQEDLDNLQTEIDENTAAIEARTGKSKEELQIALTERSRILGEERADREEAMNLAQEAVRNGAPTNIAARMAQAKTPAEAMEIGGQYIGLLDRQLKNAQIAKAKQALTEAATTGDTSGFENTASLVRDSIARVLGTGEYDALFEGAGANPIAEFVRRNVGSRATDFSRLGAQLDTIRSNMLMLGSDPGIRDFFGPQMSEADVRMMMASATRLQEGNQTPDEVKQEVQRIDQFIGKLDAAIQAKNSGITLNANVITAPNGDLIEIID